MHLAASNLWLDGCGKGSQTLNDQSILSCGIGGTRGHGLALMADGWTTDFA